MVAEVDEIADELYQLPPEEFIAARDERARELSKAKERDAAKVVKALRRPTVPAWAVNQLRWQAGDDLDELLETGDKLRAAQEAAIRDPEGGRGDLREVIKRHRGLIQKLTDAAAQVLRGSERDPAQHRGPIEATLLAASSDESVADVLRAGRFTTTADAPGFGDVPLDWTPPERTATPLRKPRPRQKAKAKPASDEKDEPPAKAVAIDAKARREQVAAQQRLRDVERLLARARRRLEAAEEERSAAAAEVERLERQQSEASAALA